MIRVGVFFVHMSRSQEDAGYAIYHHTDVVFLGPTNVIFVGAVEGYGCFGDVGDRNLQSSLRAQVIDPAGREVQGDLHRDRFRALTVAWSSHASLSVPAASAACTPWYKPAACKATTPAAKTFSVITVSPSIAPCWSIEAAARTAYHHVASAARRCSATGG